MAQEPKDGSPDQIRAVPLEDVRRARGESKVAMPRSKVASLRAFRRVRADRTLGVIGILLLLIGITLIFAWEKPPVVEKKYGVEWPQTVHVEDAIVGANLVEGAAARSHTYELTAVNATVITFSLLWDDEIGNQAIENDELELDIKGPNGVNVTNATIRQKAKQGNITIPLALNSIPDIASVNADNERDAFQGVGDRTNRTGIGTWTIGVRVISAPGDVKNEATRPQASTFCDPRLPDNANCTPDGRENYEIRVSYATYSLRLKKLFD
jgi:hypothetical protein